MLHTCIMELFSSLLNVAVAFALVAQPPLQCSCDWRWRTVDGENVENSLCYRDNYIVFKADKKTVTEESPFQSVLFNVTVSKIITRKGGEEDIPDGKKITLEAPTQNSMCGYIDFTLNESGILSVDEVKESLPDRISFNGCSYYKAEAEVTAVERRLMTGEIQCQGQEPSYNV